MTAGEWLWVDGEPGATVPADDRGLLLADGVFETVRLEDRHPQQLDYHRSRMAAGLSALQFPNPKMLAHESLDRVLKWACDHPGHAGDAVLRVTITRGSGSRGYLPPLNPSPRLIARLSSTVPSGESPIKLATVSVAWSEQARLAGLKLLARTEQSLASLEARLQGYDDALMRDSRGRLISCASGNLFFRTADTLLTPRLDTCGIAGTRRSHILAGLGAYCGYRVEQVDCELALLASIEEVFVCNAVVGVSPIQSITHEGTTWTFPDHTAGQRLAPLIHKPMSDLT